MATEGGTKAIVAALLANLGIAVTKFVAFLLTRSSSMLAESIHSVADSGNQALLLLGGRRAKREATPQHPFGYGRERYVYAFIVSIVLFSVGGLFALYEAWSKWAEPHAIDSWQWVPVTVLVVAIVIAVPAAATADEVSAAIDAAERRVRDAVPIARVIYLEPDLHRTPAPPPGDHAIRRDHAEA